MLKKIFDVNLETMALRKLKVIYLVKTNSFIAETINYKR